VKKADTLQHTLNLIGTQLVLLRKKKGYKSHETFCYDFDLPRMQYWRMENGKTNVTLKSLHRVLDIHNMPVEDFFSSLTQAAEKETSRKDLTKL
jgi:transcriptional regulator with XRE-family HTH domain